MKRKINRLLSFLLALSMILSLITVVSAAPSSTDVVTTPTGYTSASDVVYSTVNGYIVNWGARGEDCTFLSTYAQEFYTTGYTYDELAALAGGTTASAAASSELYAKLNELTANAHTTYTTYSGSSSVDCKNFYPYTDCVSNDTTQVSLLYQGTLVSSTWDSGTTYNQEHVWPKSNLTGSNSTDKGDIMHLRAADPSENSSRNNKSYGLGDGSYDPGVSVRGDVARTILYMFVRWGNTDTLFGTGSTGAFESLDTLLAWMAEDPVDTWEMGRNDAVQSITGTRNVFVDYPELAFELFETEIPADMITPSSTEAISSGGMATLVTDVSTLAAGDKIIIAASSAAYALGTTQNTNNRAVAEITKSDTTASYGSDTQVITLEAGTIDGTFAFAVDGGYLYASSASSNYLKTEETLSDNSSWTITVDATGVATAIANGTNTRNDLRYNNSSKLFSCYASTSTMQAISIYEIESVHVHSYTESVTAPTCTEDGATVYTCTCGYSYDEPIAALGHSYTDGVCVNCGNAEPATVTAKLATSLGDLTIGKQIIIVATDYDVALSTTQNGNNRGQAVVVKNADDNTLTFGEDTQLITLENGTVTGTYAFNVGTGYLYAASSSSNYLKTQTTLDDNGSWLISFADGVATLTAQGTNTRNGLQYNPTNSIFSCYSTVQKTVSIYILDTGDTHTHSYTETITTAATCEADGLKTFTCDCGNSYSEAIPATGHSYVGGVCSACGVNEPVATGWVKIDLANITASDVIAITMTNADGTWALYNGNAASSAPTAVAVTVNGDTMTAEDAASISWNITSDATGLIIYVAGTTETWLYSTAANNGVRVGTNTNQYWTLDATTGYLMHQATSRYMGVYNSQDWRAYTSVNNNIKDQTLTFWKYSEASAPECSHSYTEEITTAAGCETAGVKTFTCSACGDSYTEEIAATGHSYVDGTCSACGAAEPVSGDWVKVELSQITASDIIAITMTGEAGTWALYNGNAASSAPTAVVVTVSGNTMSCDDVASISWNIASDETGLIIYVAGTTETWLYSTSTNNGVRVGTNTNQYWTLDATTGYLMHQATGRYLGVYNAQDWRAYTNTTGNTANQTLSFWKYSGGETPACTHENLTTVTVDATCDTAGSTTVTCDDCGEVVSAETIAATGHSYENYVCTGCGDVQNITIYFDTAVKGWANVNAYAWNEAGSASEWPGSAMTLVSGTVYSIQIPGNMNNIIFNNGTYQTGDLSVPGDGYAHDGYQWVAYGESFTTKFHVTGGDALGSWDAAYAAGLMTNLGGGIFSVTFENVPAGTHEYKITNGTWDVSWGYGEGNFSFTVNAVSNVTIKFDVNTNSTTVETVCLHEHQAVVTAPTCTEGGYTTYTCPCGDSYVADEVAALGHSFESGFCTVCGAEDPDYVEVVVPTISLKYPTLLLEDVIKLNIYFTIDQDIELSKMGLLTWTSAPSTVDISTADAVIPGAVYDSSVGYYGVTTEAIPAQNLGDVVYFCIYAELADGSIAYGKQVSYSPTTYAYNQLKAASTTDAAKSLYVAILNYGAAAQTYLSYNTDALINASLTDEMKAYVNEYSSDMVHSVSAVSATKQGSLASNGGFSAKKPSISLDGAFAINYYFTPNATVDGEMTFYYWNAADFAAVDVLSIDNATGSAAMTAENGVYGAAIEGIAAKDIDSALYACGVYTDVDGNTYSTGILPYSLGVYCGNQAVNGTEKVQPLAAAIAVYGYYAANFFAGN